MILYDETFHVQKHTHKDTRAKVVEILHDVELVSIVVSGHEQAKHVANMMDCDSVCALFQIQV